MSHLSRIADTCHRGIEAIEAERITDSADGYPSALWGLHLLAWATGLQDIIANVLLASLALPSMAGACCSPVTNCILIISFLQLLRHLQHLR